MKSWRHSWRAVGAAILCCASLGQAQTGAWKPEKNVEIVVGLTAGSSQDRTARALQSIAQAKALLGVNSTVVNRVGGGGNIAWTYLATHAGDAHWLQIASPTILTNYIIGTAQFAYTDYTPLALLGNQYIAFAVRADSPLKTARDLTERLRADPAAVSIGINSLGSYLHLVCALTARAAGMDPKKLKLVVFQGGELMTAGLGGHVDVIATVTSNLLPHVQGGKLRLLGISSARRLAGALAKVPTLKEQGADVVLANWQGVFGPPRLAAAQVAYWDGMFGQLVKTAEWRRDQEQNLWESDYLNAADYARFLKTDFDQARAIFAELGLARKDN
ncbi:MAG: tripartite tricarboxylate transporter substrate binding protein [Burkholderiales bacterium]